MSEHTKQSETMRRVLARDMEVIERLRTDLAKALPAESEYHEVLHRTLLHLRDNTTDSPCMVKAAPDEPVFVLRGQDTFAADTVVDWITRVVDGWALKNNMPPDKLVENDPKLAAKIKDAHGASAQMRAYRKKFPD